MLSKSVGVSMAIFFTLSSRKPSSCLGSGIVGVSSSSLIDDACVEGPSDASRMDMGDTSKFSGMSLATPCGPTWTIPGSSRRVSTRSCRTSVPLSSPGEMSGKVAVNESRFECLPEHVGIKPSNCPSLPSFRVAFLAAICFCRSSKAFLSLRFSGVMVEDLLSADCICLAMGCSEGAMDVSGSVDGDTAFGDGRGASGISGIGGRPLADFDLPGTCFFDGSRTPFGRVDMSRKSVALSLLSRRPEESRDGRGPILTLGLYSYEVLVVLIDGLLDWMEGRRPSMLDLVSRKVSSNAFRVVPLS